METQNKTTIKNEIVYLINSCGYLKQLNIKELKTILEVLKGSDYK